jgi:hypothetical protein
VVREDPDRAGLLYAGTEFGIYVSFDNGANWQSLQMNLPHTPVTDIKVAHKDLVLSTQGRSFWILDNLTPLHQASTQIAAAPAHVFVPREAVRTNTRRGGGPSGGGSGLQYPQPGAQIDYYLGAAAGEVKMEIVDGAGKVVRTFTSSTGIGEEADGGPDAGGGDDAEGGFRFRGGPTRLDKTAGMHRFTWDLRYPGPWQSAQRPEGPNGPMAVPGKYAVRLTVGSYTATQPLVVVEDPRNLADNVTLSDLQQQFDHNMRVRELVSEANRTVARVRAEQSKASGEREVKLKQLADKLITPAIRYSQPEQQTQITYLYSVTTATDQKPGRDVVERYGVLKKELEERERELEGILAK